MRRLRSESKLKKLIAVLVVQSIMGIREDAKLVGNQCEIYFRGMV